MNPFLEDILDASVELYQRGDDFLLEYSQEGYQDLKDRLWTPKEKKFYKYGLGLVSPHLQTVSYLLGGTTNLLNSMPITPISMLNAVSNHAMYYPLVIYGNHKGSKKIDNSQESKVIDQLNEISKNARFGSIIESSLLFGIGFYVSTLDGSDELSSLLIGGGFKSFLVGISTYILQGEDDDNGPRKKKKFFSKTKAILREHVSTPEPVRT